MELSCQAISLICLVYFISHQVQLTRNMENENKTKKCNVNTRAHTVHNYYTASQKTTLMLQAISSTHINRFWQF